MSPTSSWQPDDLGEVVRLAPVSGVLAVSPAAAHRVLDRDELALELLARPAVRTAIVIPSVAALIYGALGAEVADAELFAALVGAGLVLAAGTVLVTRPGGDQPRHRRAVRLWQLVSATIGTALLAPFLNVALETDPARFAPLIALVLVAMAYSLPRRRGIALAVWTLLVWFATLWWAGLTEPAVLWLHLGGGALVFAASLVIGESLSAAVLATVQARKEAQRRASLLATVLRVRSLDAGEVARHVADGLVDQGFDLVAIRRVDLLSRTATLEASAPSDSHELRATVELDVGLLGAAVREARTIVVDDVDEDPRAVDHGFGLRGAAFVPLFQDGEVAAVIAVASMSGPLSTTQQAALQALAAEAEGAFVRARAYASDRRTIEELRRLDERTRDFVSTVSHELRTPLTVIQGLGQTLRARWDELPSERRTDLLHRIDANGVRLAGMVRSLMDSDALERGELDLTRQPVALRGAALALLDRLATVTAAHPVELDVDPALEVDVDPDLFDHVVENLLTNVAKHTPQGTRVRVSAAVDAASEDRVVVTVSDDGPGIAPDDLPHVFDRFYRGGEPDRREVGGLGLGLALARQIVEAHDGELEVVSSSRGGTAFRFSVAAAR